VGFALRAGLNVRNYGFFIDLAPYRVPLNVGGIPNTIRDPFASNTPVSTATKGALMPVTDVYFRGLDDSFRISIA